MTKKTFYVYVHTRNDTGAVFYVGKGHGTRIDQRTNRNKHWRNIVGKHGHTSVKLEDFSSEDDAFAMERYLIASYRAQGDVLVNLTEGGDGAAGRVVSQVSREKQSASISSAWADPIVKLRHKNSKSTAAYVYKIRAATLSSWSDPDYASTMRNHRSSNAFKETMRAATTASWARRKALKEPANVQGLIRLFAQS